MSSPEGDNSDFTEVKDLDKLFEMLTKTIEKLNSKLDDFGNTTGQASAGNQDWHKTQALLKIELEKERGRQVRMNKDHAKALSDGGNQMKLFTGMLTKGLPIGAAFGMLTGKAEKLAQQYENNQQELASLESSLKNLNERLNDTALDPKERSTLERAKEVQQCLQKKGYCKNSVICLLSLLSDSRRTSPSSHLCGRSNHHKMVLCTHLNHIQ